MAGDFTLEASFYTDYRKIGYYSPHVYDRRLGCLLKKIDMHTYHNIMTLILLLMTYLSWIHTCLILKGMHPMVCGMSKVNGTTNPFHLDGLVVCSLYLLPLRRSRLSVVTFTINLSVQHCLL